MTLDPTMLHGSTQASSSSAPAPSSSTSSERYSDGVPTAIFLSHSGKQKPFVENLFHALQRVNHFAFFDKHSLRKGEKFPERIKKAARGCEVGVVVLSEDFLVSKWPMIELEILVLQRGSEAKVLPLFYKLKPSDLKNEVNLSRWRQEWEKFVAPDVVEKWEEALRTLRGFNGESFTDGSSEHSYINTVVRNLCKLVPSPLREDLSPIKGHERLAEVVARYYDAARQCDDKALLVGLHGVGGLGKTTMCKIMANFYSAEYPGRCHHLELPTPIGEDIMPRIVQKCKEALKQLTNLSPEFLNNASSFDQIIELMKTHLRQVDVFLAIDNVWEDSFEAAKRILRVGLSANSKILLTSRSERILNDLLSAHSNVCVRQLPAINYDEAFRIFQDAFGEDGIDFLESCREQVDPIIKKFMFDRNYHALALKALGAYVRKGCIPGDLKENKKFLSCVYEQIGSEDLGTFEGVIRIRYDILPEQKKNMFLDIAVIIPMLTSLGYWWRDATYKEANQWLSILYHEEQLSATRIRTLIYELAQDGLVQIEMDSYDDTLGQGSGTDCWRVGVHDLYSDLAHREAATSSRFFICGKSNKPLEQIEWQNLERVVLGSGENSTLFIKKAQQQECKKLKVLMRDGRVGPLRIELLDMRCFPSLCVLYLGSVTLSRIKNWSAASRLRSVFLSGEVGPAFPKWVSKFVPHIRDAGHLLEPPSSTRVLSLGALSQLQVPNLYNCRDLERISGLHYLENLETRLRSVFLSGEVGPASSYNLSAIPKWVSKFLAHIRDAGHFLEPPSSTRVLSLGALSQLQVLNLYNCRDLERISGLDYLENLETLTFSVCGRLESLDGLSALTRLKVLRITFCEKVKRLPDLSSLTCLEELLLEHNDNMVRVEGVSPPALNSIQISFCKAFERTPDLSGSTVLEKLWLHSNLSMKTVRGVLSSSLTDLHLESYWGSQKMVDFSGLTRLEKLRLSIWRMEELGALSSSVRVMEICSMALKRVPDLSGVHQLDELTLEIPKMEELGALSSSLRVMKLRGCYALKRVPDLSGLTCLAVLALVENREIEEVGQSTSTLQEIRISGCRALKKMPDLSGLTRLHSLSLDRNELLEEVGGQYVSSTLQSLTISNCECMRRFPSLKDCVQLREVEVSHNTIAIVASSAPPNVRSLGFLGGKWLFTSEQMESFTLVKELRVYACDVSRIMDLACLSPLVNLTSLLLSSISAVEEIVNVGELQGLECIRLQGFRRLKKFDGFDWSSFGSLSYYWPVYLQRCMSEEGRVFWTITKD